MSGDGGRRQIPTWLVLAVGAVGAGAVAWASGQRGWAAVLAAAGVTLTLAAYLADRGDTRAGDTDMAVVADRLADQVKDQWSAEAKRRDLTRPPLSVSWRPADPSLVQPWAYLQRLAVAGAGWTLPASPGAGPHELAGTGSDLVKVLDRVPTGRLVVLGEPGSGKTVLLIRLVLDLLTRRAPDEPVPLLVPLASWNPDRRDLYSWLETQILRAYPWLASTSATGVSRARALLSAGLVLPVLDGLDEIRSGDRYRALAAINDTLHDGAGLILSCRAKAFRHAIRPGPHRQPIFVEGAAGIRLGPLDPDDVADYLTETAGEGGQARWAPVCAALAATPAPPVAQALSTPLMANLARTIYNPRQADTTLGLPNPADLCDITELPTRTAVEEHLFDGLVPAAYRPRPGQPNRWTTAQAELYLIFLARHLEHRLHTTSLAWWELPRAVPRALPAGVAGIVGGVAFGLTFALTIGVIVGDMVGYGFERVFEYMPARAVGHSVERSFGLMFGSIAAVVFASVFGLGDRSPRQVVLRRPRLPDLVRGLVRGLAAGLVFGLSAGAAFVLAFGLAWGLPFGVAFGAANGIDAGIIGGLWNGYVGARFFGIPFGRSFGLVAGASAGLMAGIVVWFGLATAADTRRAADPQTVLAQDRAAGFAAALLSGLGTELAVGLEPLALVGAGTAFGFVVGLASGFAAGLGSAWGRFSLARLWLAWRGRQPLRMMAFLIDAHERGVLRQAGAVWEFRHANLQRRLADRP